MKRTNGYWTIIGYVGLCSVLIAAPQASRPAAAKQSAVTSATEGDSPEPARIMSYTERDVISVRTKLRYTTLIVLPKNEQILDFTCGDKEFWVVNGNQNFAYIKPAKAGAQTNLNLVTASGNAYSFVLSEVSDTRVQPDLKLFVQLKDENMVAASRSAPKFVSAQEVEQVREDLVKAREEIRQTKSSAQDAVDKGIRQFVSNVRFPYHFEAGKKPFFVRAMYHDNRFTYIQARPEETPTLYEVRDGQPNLVNFTYKDGVYEVEKILDRGYLAIGKQKLAFTRGE